MSLLSCVAPMPLAGFGAPFDHPDWIFEPNWTGFERLRMWRGRLSVGIAQREYVQDI